MSRGAIVAKAAAHQAASTTGHVANAISGKQVLTIGVVGGVSSNIIGTQANESINKKRAQVSGFYKRKLKSGKTIKVAKAPAHGVGINQVQNGGVM